MKSKKSESSPAHVDWTGLWTQSSPYGAL
ncbi:unnamed protein product, partial [Didymodactylos carnosus]